MSGVVPICAISYDPACSAGFWYMFRCSYFLFFHCYTCHGISQGCANWAKNDDNINSWCSQHNQDAGDTQAAVNIGCEVSFLWNNYSKSCMIFILYLFFTLFITPKVVWYYLLFLFYPKSEIACILIFFFFTTQYKLPSLRLWLSVCCFWYCRFHVNFLIATLVKNWITSAQNNQTHLMYTFCMLQC